MAVAGVVYVRESVGESCRKVEANAVMFAPRVHTQCTCFYNPQLLYWAGVGIRNRRRIMQKG